MDIYAEIARLRKEGRRAALATIIQVQGSIPSYESSKILIRDDGSIVGTVGGGCVEAEVWSVAQDVMREEKPRRLHFNLNQNPEYDEGLVCGGSLDIFIEPRLPKPLLLIFGDGPAASTLARLAELTGFRTRAVSQAGVATLEVPPGEAYAVVATMGHFDEDALEVALGHAELDVSLIASARRAAAVRAELARRGLDEHVIASAWVPGSFSSADAARQAVIDARQALARLDALDDDPARRTAARWARQGRRRVV